MSQIKRLQDFSQTAREYIFGENSETPSPLLGALFKRAMFNTGSAIEAHDNEQTAKLIALVSSLSDGNEKDEMLKSLSQPMRKNDYLLYQEIQDAIQAEERLFNNAVLQRLGQTVDTKSADEAMGKAYMKLVGKFYAIERLPQGELISELKEQLDSSVSPDDRRGQTISVTDSRLQLTDKFIKDQVERAATECKVPPVREAAK